MSNDLPPLDHECPVFAAIIREKHEVRLLTVPQLRQVVEWHCINLGYNIPICNTHEHLLRRLAQLRQLAEARFFY